jgi:hypothetical protein
MLQENDIILILYCAIADKFTGKDKKHPQGKLYLSEIILCGVLFVLKGKSFRQFYTWLGRKNILPNLPDRTRLIRLLITHHQACNEFLEDETFFNVIDSLGIEILHPIREGRSEQSQKVSQKGKSNHRWIIGRKINIAANRKLSVVRYEDETANVCDNIFNDKFADLWGIVLGDMGYRKKGGHPGNFKICKKGTWNERMLLETLFSLWTRVCNIKKSFHRTIKGFKAKISYLVALSNIILRKNESLGFKRLSMVQWAL